MTLYEGFGGRIAPNATEVDLRTLTSDEEHNAGGSYSYPPAPRNARQAMAFWLRCPVPDGVMRAVAAAQTRLMQDRRDAADEILQRGALTAKARERRLWAEAELGRIHFVDRRNLRSVIRVAKLGEYANGLPPQQQEQVHRCVFVLDTGEFRTPVELIQLYGLDAVWAAFEDDRERRNQAQYEAIIETRNIWARSVNSSTPLRPY